MEFPGGTQLCPQERNCGTDPELEDLVVLMKVNTQTKPSYNSAVEFFSPLLNFLFLPFFIVCFIPVSSPTFLLLSKKKLGSSFVNKAMMNHRA